MTLSTKNYTKNRLSQGRRHGFESGGQIVGAKRAENFFDPTFWPVGDKILLR